MTLRAKLFYMYSWGHQKFVPQYTFLSSSDFACMNGGNHYYLLCCFFDANGVCKHLIILPRPLFIFFELQTLLFAAGNQVVVTCISFTNLMQAQRKLDRMWFVVFPGYSHYIFLAFFQVWGYGGCFKDYMNRVIVYVTNDVYSLGLRAFVRFLWWD